MRRQNFNCDCSVQPRVARFVDLTHSARANWRDDFVVAEHGPILKRHSAGIIRQLDIPAVYERAIFYSNIAIP